jgi:hypothetical protein
MSFRMGACGAAMMSVLWAGPALAENIVLDCEVQVQMLSQPDGRLLETADRGTWSFSIYPGDSTRIHVVRSNAYLPPNVAGADPFNNHLDEDVWVTDDAYQFCPEAFGRCGEACIEIYEACGPDITARHVEAGWHRIQEARLDRRRGAFQVTMDVFDPAVGAVRRQVYSGPCTRLPEPQF